MKTFKVSNGDLAINRGIGQPTMTDGIEKSSQDVAREFLIEYNPSYNEGNELLSLGLGQPDAFGLSEGLVVQQLYQCVNRLIVRSQNVDSGRIIKVDQIRVRLVGLSTVVYMVEVTYDNGNSTTLVDQFTLKPVELNQLLVNPGGLLSI